MFLTKAETIENIYRAFLGNPLDFEDLDFYIETHEVRGGTNAKNRIARRLNNVNDTSLYMLFVGYKGCGKSTELVKLQQNLKDSGDKFLVVTYSLEKDLNAKYLNYIEIFILTMEKLFHTAYEHNLEIKQELFESLRKWVSIKEIEEEAKRYNLIEGEITNNIQFYKNFFLKFRKSASTSNSMKEVLKRVIEPRLPDLITLCNKLIYEVKTQLHKIQKENILVIIEDSDKLDIEQAKDLFFNHISQLTQIDVTTIYTFPIALYHSAMFATINQYFNDRYELPMIKVREKSGNEYDAGIEALKTMVAKRMNLTLFESPEILKQMILMTGGCIRDLFRLIRGAADEAQDENAKKISMVHYQKALQYLITDYQNVLSDTKIDNKVYLVDDFYEELITLYNDKNKNPENTEIMYMLRQTLCVLGYNGEFWHDIHPIVVEILRRKGKIV